MVLVGDPTGILDEKKWYMNPETGSVFSGKAWLSVANRSKYDIFDAEWFKSFVEVKRDKKNKTWVKAKR